MKKNLVMRIAAVVLMCTLVTACFASSTFAKYTSGAEGTATATVAKWDVTVNDQKLGVDNATVTFDLMEVFTNSVNTPAETVNGKKLAPGTDGSFSFKITNASDVAAEAVINLAYNDDNEVELPTSFVFATDENFEDAITMPATLDKIALPLDADKTVTIYWKWIFEDGVDEDDTALGLAAGSLKVDATITVEQVD